MANILIFDSHFIVSKRSECLLRHARIVVDKIKVKMVSKK